MLVIWCEFWVEGIMGPFFFKNAAGGHAYLWSLYRRYYPVLLKQIAVLSGMHVHGVFLLWLVVMITTGHF